MLSLITQMLPLIAGGLVGWTGGTKLLPRRAERQAKGSVLAHILPNPRAATLGMRVVGAVELVLAAALLTRPMSSVAVFGMAALGVGFVCVLWYARVTAPESSCGCTSTRHTPITWRSFARAGLVAGGGAASAAAPAPWWSAAAHRPVAAIAVTAGMVAVFCIMSGELDHLWLLPLRRARVRLFGHPLAGTAGQVPLAATEELLQRSLAWQSAAPVIRSALVDHWDSGGWRLLRYSGIHQGPAGPQPVSVVFALDANASTETVSQPVVRVSVVDEEGQQAVTDRVLERARRPLLPIAAPRLNAG